MRKLKYISGVIFLIVGISFILIRPAKGENSITFPVSEAGIAAYTSSSVPLTLEHLTKAGDELVRNGESYVIVKVKNLGGIDNSPVHVYIGLDGWIVSYYLRKEPRSKMIITGGGSPKAQIVSTTLQKAIEKVCSQMEVNCFSSVKYYDFEFPEANKITLVAQALNYDYNSRQKDFFVNVPGTLYEASYTIKGNLFQSGFCWQTNSQSFSLKVDTLNVLNETFDWNFNLFNGEFDINDYFQANVAHRISLEVEKCGYLMSGFAFVYKN